LNGEPDDILCHHEATLTDAVPPPQIQPTTVYKIFIGKDGLRAGWSLLIFIAFFASFAFSIRLIGRMLHLPSIGPGSEISPGAGLSFEGINFFVIFLISWIMAKIEGRPVSVYGFGGRRRLPNFFAGMAWGIVCVSLLVFVLMNAGFLVVERRMLFGSDVFRYGFIWLLGFLLVGLSEEYLSRGYVQYTLTRGLAGFYEWAFKTRHSTVLAFWTSAVIFSILFGLGHLSNPGESPIGLLSAGLAGVVWCLSLWRTGSLWWAIGFHAAWDWGQSFVYGVPDSGLIIQHHLVATNPAGKPILSGGTTGPEGSVFILGILVLILVIILFTLPKGHYGQGARAFEMHTPPA
jgi:uncharacterized protein